MANAFYNPSGAPVTSSFGASASIRAEFSAIAAGFDKLPSSLTANKAVVVNAGATGLTISTGTLTLNGNLSVATGKTVTLSNTLTFTGTDGSSVNFGAGGTVVFGVSGTANEISVSTVSGTATVSLPTSLTFTGKTVTGGTFSSPTLSGTVAGAHSYSGTITFTGNVSQNGDITQLRVQNTATTSAVVLSTVKGWLGSGTNVTDMAIGATSGLNIYVNNSGLVALGLSTTGAATFASTVSAAAASGFYLGANAAMYQSGNYTILLGSSSNQFVLSGNAGDPSNYYQNTTHHFRSINGGATYGTINATAWSPANLLDISAAGAGQIKFPATQNPSADANTLDDYEEGTWTPTDASGTGLSFSGVVATYTKIGRQVTVTARLQYPATADGATAIIGGLPFTVNSTNSFIGACINDKSFTLQAKAITGTTTVQIFEMATGGSHSNAGYSNGTFQFTITYFV